MKTIKIEVISFMIPPRINIMNPCLFKNLGTPTTNLNLIRYMIDNFVVQKCLLNKVKYKQ